MMLGSSAFILYIEGNAWLLFLVMVYQKLAWSACMQIVGGMGRSYTLWASLQLHRLLLLLRRVVCLAGLLQNAWWFGLRLL